MDPNLQLIFGFVILALLIVMPAVYFFISAEAKHKERKLELQARIEEAKASQKIQLNENQAHLEDRMRVLERIVTDPSADLSRQIDDLRALDIEREKVQ